MIVGGHPFYCLLVLSRCRAYKQHLRKSWKGYDVRSLHETTRSLVFMKSRGCIRWKTDLARARYKLVTHETLVSSEQKENC